jgi:hypothetical protein
VRSIQRTKLKAAALVLLVMAVVFILLAETDVLVHVHR